MSLNGLDDAKVAEAYQWTLAEPGAGGWFLLKYVSRDAVEIHTRGTGGAAEARGAIAQYEEKSPLYGFLLYRRRKVLIKYLPEGTSRLLQARVAVHFTAVTEKFTPHDTTISIAAADELSDAALASACSLHTAAPSSSSSSASSHRHKLDEITEDAEEGQSTAGESSSTARPATLTSSIPTIIEPPKPETKIEIPIAVPEAETKNAEEGKTSPELSHVTIETVAENDEHAAPKTAPLAKTFRDYDALFEHGPDPRLSSQTTRPAMSDLYAEIYAQYNKPKVKLGPRPKQSLDIKRPHTSGNGTQGPARPVSSLPAGLRTSNRKTAEPKRPKSRDNSTVPSIAFPPPPPVPAVPEIPLSPAYPPKSPASVRSMPVSSSHGRHHKSLGITPEKQRLMKALEMRKKQMKAKQERETKEAEAAVTSVEPNAEAIPEANETPDQDSSPMESLAEEPSSTAVSEKEPAEPPVDEAEPASTQEISIQDDKSPPRVPDDLDVGMTSSQTETDDIHSAASASSPTSAQTHGSSCAPSTRPSSISEDDPQAPEEEKSTSSEEPAVQMDEKVKEDEESIESSPTVVPESSTPIPSVEVSAQPNETPAPATEASASDDFLVRRSKRESMVLMPPSNSDDIQSRRKSKRESMLFMPPTEPLDALQNRKQKRESMILAAPIEGVTTEHREKRQAMVEPIHISAEHSEAEYLSDDSFMEELQSAKFEEAKPISVSKSPITPFFSRKPSVTEYSIPERSNSQKIAKAGRYSPEPSSRKSSGPWLQHASTDTVVVAKKINVSSGISQRIKALAEKSNRDSTASVSPSASPEASNSIVAQRKSSFFSTPPSGNSPNGKPIQRLSRASFANVSNSTTPDKKPVMQPPSSPEQSKRPVYNIQQGPEKPESVQVTARIVRDPRVQKPTLTMPTQDTPLELHLSPIIIDHQRSTRPPSSSKHSPTKADPTSPRPPSSSHSKDANASLPRSSSESSWRSFGRRLSESKSGPPRNLPAFNYESGDEKPEKKEKKEKKDSRTSKLFKRMSTIPSSISRKNSAASSNLPEEDLPATLLPSLREPPPVQVGDLNIQFPDTLLWKRRWVEVDVAGNLVLSLSRSNEQSKGITKRFHLTEFRTPYAPDQDRQELPNSVILDFIDGRTLQCACETFMAQTQVLQILREAHDAWLAYNQGQ